MVKSAKEGNGAAAGNPEAEERKRLKKLAISNKLVAEAPPSAKASSVALAPSKTVTKHHGRDILRKSNRKNRFLFSFPGLLAPISAGGKIGELKDLGSKNPLLYLDFPQGQMKLFGTIVYPKNRYLTLQFSRGGKNVICEDYFDTLIVFSEAWWIGRKDENPDELRLVFPEDLNMGQQPEYDFKGGAGSTSEIRVIDRDEVKLVKQQSPKREREYESSDSQNDLKDLMQVTPTRHSARTASKTYKFAETSSGDDSDEIKTERSEEEDKAVSLGTSTRNKHSGKTERSSVAFNIDDKDAEVITNLSEQLPQSAVSATKSKDPSSISHGSLVQATISTLFKKVEEKKAPGKLKPSSSSKVSNKNLLEAESNEKADQPKKRTPRTKGKAVKQTKAGNKSTARRKQPEVEDDEIEEFSSASQGTDGSDEDWGA